MAIVGSGGEVYLDGGHQLGLDPEGGQVGHWFGEYVGCRLVDLHAHQGMGRV